MTGPNPLYRNRGEAGRILAEYISARSDMAGIAVLALARGGVPVADEIAREFDAPLDVVLVRKIRLLDQPGIAIGAVAEGSIQVLDEAFAEAAEISPAEIRAMAEVENREIDRCGALYRGGGMPPVRGRPVLLVDDGLRTGYSMRAAIAAVRRLNPSRVAVAVPVGTRDACQDLSQDVDELICPFHPSSCRPIGDWYSDYSPPTDDEVVRRLARDAVGPRRGLRAA